MSANQIFEVNGELRIITPASTSARVQGRVNFTDPEKRSIGEMKVFGGTLSSYRMILDTSAISNGLSFRTAPSSGTIAEGGQGFPYTMNINKSYVEVNAPTTFAPLFTQNGNTDQLLVKINKSRDTISINDISDMLEITMNNFIEGQRLHTTLGTTASGYRSVWGYRGGYTPLSSNYAYLGMMTGFGNSCYENVQLFRTGAVAIPARLDVGIIRATTYENLPAVPAAQLLPLTLDAASGRVGINNAAPREALDVTGSVKVSENIDVDGNVNVGGTMTAHKVHALIYENLPPVDPADLLPLTLDKTNHRVGINNFTPTCPLDIVDIRPEIFLGKTDVAKFIKPVATQGEEIGISFGSGTPNGTAYMRARNNFGVDRGILFGVEEITDHHLLRLQESLSTLYTSLWVTGEIVANNGGYWAFIQRQSNVNYNLLGREELGPSVIRSSLTSVGTLTSLAVSGNLTVDTSTLVVDAVNNRVGINKAVPTVACDIVGTTNVQGSLQCTSIVATQSYFSTTNSTGVKLQLRGSGNSNIATSTDQVNFCAPDPSSFVFYSGGTNNDGVEILRINSSGLVLKQPITLPTMSTIPGPGQVGHREHETLLADTTYTGNMSVVSMTLGPGTWTVQGCAAIMPAADPCFVYWTMIALNYQPGTLVNNVATGELVERNVCRQELWPGGGVWPTTLTVRANMVLTETKTIHVNLNLGLNTPTDIVNIKATESYIVATRIA